MALRHVPRVQATGKDDRNRHGSANRRAEGPGVNPAGATQVLDREALVSRIKHQPISLAGNVQSLRGYWQAYYRLRRATMFDFETGNPIQ